MPVPKNTLVASHSHSSWLSSNHCYNTLEQQLSACDRSTESNLIMQLKEIWVDAWCPCLTDTWESTAYQRAIAVDALWLTFMRMLEPTSRIKVRNIICTDPTGVYPFEPDFMYTCTASQSLGCKCFMTAFVEDRGTSARS